MGQRNEPHMGEGRGQEPHMGETEEPKGTGKKPASTGTGTSKETGADKDDAEKSGMRPTGSGGSAPMTENM
jgi:hypothetical protein